MNEHTNPEQAIRDLAKLCGVSPMWTDHTGATRSVAAQDLKRILGAAGWPCGRPYDLAHARAQALQQAAGRELPPLITLRAGAPLRVPADGLTSQRARIVFEDGGTVEMLLEEDSDGYVRGAPVDRIGYHQLLIGGRQTTLAVAPQRCFTVDDIVDGGRLYGLTAQIYGLRTAGDGGIGTFAGVEALCAVAARHGADALALSPTHALFCADPGHFSPYSPSTRLFRNPSHADLTATFAPARIAAAMARGDCAQDFARLEALPLVDWKQASAARQRLFASLYEDFRLHELAHANSAPLAQDFQRFCLDGGAALRDHSRFEALHAHHFRADYTKWDWRTWSAGYRDPGSSEVAAFAHEHAHSVDYHAFLQWIAERSQGAAQRAAQHAGMRIGLIADLAVGMNAGGSHAWSQPDDVLVGLNVGAPPDPLAPRGQNWGLTAFSPRALRASGFASFLATLRAMFRHAGGIRIDHVMGLARLWLVPEGEDASHGAYVAYPFEDMLRLVTLESHRHQAIVIGEDLGTVPHGFRERLADAGVYGMRVMQFERDGEAFHKPEWYARNSVAMSSTHDLPTIAGWWGGRDLATREDLDQFGPSQSRATEEASRSHERTMLWRALRDTQAASGPEPSAQRGSEATDAALRFLARTSSCLALAPVEDVMGVVEQPNLPGTTDAHPNWRRRYDGEARRMLDEPEAVQRLQALHAERRKA